MQAANARSGSLQAGRAPCGFRALVSPASIKAGSIRRICRAVPSSSTAADLLHLTQDTFYDYLAAEADKLVVIDFYTDWCGPCKVISPELVKLAAQRPDIRIVKFNCNKSNKELGVKLGIKVAPTFHLYRNSVKVAEMTGAKLEALVALIDQHA